MQPHPPTSFLAESQLHASTYACNWDFAVITFLHSLLLNHANIQPNVSRLCMFVLLLLARMHPHERLYSLNLPGVCGVCAVVGSALKVRACAGDGAHAGAISGRANFKSGPGPSWSSGNPVSVAILNRSSHMTACLHVPFCKEVSGKTAVLQYCARGLWFQLNGFPKIFVGVPRCYMIRMLLTSRGVIRQ